MSGLSCNNRAVVNVVTNSLSSEQISLQVSTLALCCCCVFWNDDNDLSVGCEVAQLRRTSILMTI